MIIKKTAALLLSAAALLTAVGCSEEQTVTPVTSEMAAAATTQPATTTRLVKPAVLGESAELKDVVFTVNELYRSEYYGSQDGTLSNVVFVDITITNNTDEKINAHMLSSYEIYIEDEYHDSATLLALRSAQKQYGDELNLFTEGLEPGETQSGIIPAELPMNFTKAELFCLPMGGSREHYDPSSAITYTFTEDDLTPLAKPTDESDEKGEEDEEKSEEKSEDNKKSDKDEKKNDNKKKDEE